MNRLRVAGAVAVALAALGSSPLGAQTATVEGDVYLVTRGGDVKKGAAREVALIPANAALADDWEALCGEQEQTSRTFTELPEPETVEETERRVSELLALFAAQGQERAAIVRKAAVATAPTGMDAHYEVEVAPGLYLLFAEMTLPAANQVRGISVPDNTHRWLVPITLEPNESLRLDLDNKNLMESRAFNCDHNPFRDRR